MRTGAYLVLVLQHTDQPPHPGLNALNPPLQTLNAVAPVAPVIKSEKATSREEDVALTAA